ncbi:MAG: hypothetical protein ACLQU5_23140, partial [Isosphaeraceae bacterium]
KAKLEELTKLTGLFRFLVRASRDLWAFLLGEGRFPRHSHLSPEDPLTGDHRDIRMTITWQIEEETTS